MPYSSLLLRKSRYPAAFSRHGARWVLTNVHEDKPPDTFVFAVHDMMVERCSFKGSATEFCGLLKEKYGGEYFANRLTRNMFRHAYELRDLGVTFEVKRSNGQRLLLIGYDKNSDGSDGKNLMPEQVQTADPTVTECSENAEITSFSVEGDGSDTSISTDPVPPPAVPDNDADDPDYVLINGKRVPVVRMSFEDIVLRSDTRLRQKIYEERGIPEPELKLGT